MSKDYSWAIKKIRDRFDIEAKECISIIEKAIDGNEINGEISLDEWIEKRFYPNCVVIDKNGYAKMCIDALKILNKTIATDFGSSRQRDLGQLWADMTRGYLGEFAFVKYIEDRFSILCTLGHEKGELKDYLPMDIHTIIGKDGIERVPNARIGIKTTKMGGIWFDIPGDQFNHSDIHVFIKVGVGRDHLFAFFKDLSVFKDKILRHGQESGMLNDNESTEIFQWLPNFKPVIAYICGFVLRKDKFSSLPYKGSMGRTKFTIKEWKGPIDKGDLDKIKELEKIKGTVEFKSIGKFSHDKGYLFNTGNLYWKDLDWLSVIDSL